MDKNELKEIRKQRFAQMEQKLKETHPKEEDSLFYYHSSEERIVLSHALFWTMTLPQFFKSRLRKEKLIRSIGIKKPSPNPGLALAA
jgi:DNA-binding TFAR19-related protein (PDSD5 family)